MRSHLFSKNEMLDFLVKVIAQNEDDETGDRDIYEEARARHAELEASNDDVRVLTLETFVVVGYYQTTGERFTDEIETTDANTAEDLAIREHDDLVVVASFPKPGGVGVFQVNCDRCYVESTNTKRDD